MRLARVGAAGSEVPVIVSDDGSLLDLRPVTADIDASFLANRLDVALATAEAGVLKPLPHQGVRVGSPIARPGKIVGIGLNYRCHADAVGSPIPTEPIVFLKSPTSVCGPRDDIHLIPGSTTTDHEVELGVVLARPLRDATPAQALRAVGGYVLANDLSDRRLQLEAGGTWTKGKSADTYCPLGPWLATPDEVDVEAVTLRLSVNGTERQRGTTADLIFDVAEVLSYVSRLMTLEPGDLLITGTPAGVAMAAPAPRPYLRPGDIVVADGGRLGSQRSLVRASLVGARPAAYGRTDSRHEEVGA